MGYGFPKKFSMKLACLASRSPADWSAVTEYRRWQWMASSIRTDMKKKKRIWRIGHEQERTFCKPGRTGFAWQRNLGKSPWLRCDALNRRRHLGSAKGPEKRTGSVAPGCRVGCQFIDTADSYG